MEEFRSNGNGANYKGKSSIENNVINIDSSNIESIRYNIGNDGQERKETNVVIEKKVDKINNIVENNTANDIKYHKTNINDIINDNNNNNNNTDQVDSNSNLSSKRNDTNSKNDYNSENVLNELNYIDRKNIEYTTTSSILKKKRLSKLINIAEITKKKKTCLVPIEITKFDYFCYKYFYSCVNIKHQDSNKVKKQIMKLSENEMYRRTDLVNLMRHLDQITIIEKMLLNKHQIFMLRNKSKQIVYNKYNENIEAEENEKNELRIIDLIEYIKDKKDSQTLLKEDYVLLANLDTEIKDRVLKEADMDI